MFKHYARLKPNSSIIDYIFSEYFEDPIQGDVEIAESHSRHAHYIVSDTDFTPTKYLDGTEIKDRPQADIDADKPDKRTIKQIRKQIFDGLTGSMKQRFRAALKECTFFMPSLEAGNVPEILNELQYAFDNDYLIQSDVDYIKGIIGI